MNEKLDRDKYEKIKNKLLDELEAHGPVVMCKKLHQVCREMKNTVDHEQYETYVYINKKEPPAAKDIVMKAINFRAFIDAGGGGLDDIMVTVNVDDVQYKNGNLSFKGRNQNGKKSQYTFSKNDDGTWGGFYT